LKFWKLTTVKFNSLTMNTIAYEIDEKVFEKYAKKVNIEENNDEYELVVFRIKKIKEEPSTNVLTIIEYSEKSFVVFGTKTKEIKEKLKELGGKYNPSLKHQDGSSFPGWIFSKKNEEKVRSLLA